MTRARENPAVYTNARIDGGGEPTTPPDPKYLDTTWDLIVTQGGGGRRKTLIG